MKKLFLAVAAVAMVFATSCKKENINGAEEPAGDNEFVCVINQNANPQNAPHVDDGMGQMAHIDASNNVWWQEGDQIAYYGTENTQGVGRYELTCSKLSDNSAYFSAEGKHFYQGAHEAYYPASIMTLNGTLKVLTLPSTITLDANKNAAQLPMYGEGNGTHYLTFHNLCAVLKIVVPSWVKSADKIEISNTSMALNGTFTVNSDFKAVMTKTTGLTAADKKLTVNGSFTPGNVIYVPVPEGTLLNFSIRFYYGSEIFSNHANSATFQANKMYPITLKDYVCFTTSSNNSQVSFTHYNINSISIEYQTVIGGVVSAWQTYNAGTDWPYSPKIDFNAGDKVYFRAGSNNSHLAEFNSSNPWDNYDKYHFFSTWGTVNVRGDIMYLLSKDLSTTTAPDYCFYRLFRCTPLYNADLRISATSLGQFCCFEMFAFTNDARSNGRLQSAKIDIAATSVGNNCFQQMFLFDDQLGSVSILTPNLTNAGNQWPRYWLQHSGGRTTEAQRTLYIDPKITSLNSGLGKDIKDWTSSNWYIYCNGTYTRGGETQYP